ncbi:putative outer membrane adhesin like protein [Catenulispora acidiphila DSM 44928]|uniref:Putative outer membrane adhesin like protein n=1 Tax=Catenulispora acidiphila (strain DSM 44928 / JCM 14897 / NBRC 102108 / NRRL B-24433 / ID139908) TaxID=479433 RepID=C7QHV0_CATAD|nr:Ig-like domain repeat protein [Catenulispora acidiphila]ACU71125.1 putative outer membrane adhesin like protein [Catenulispora acidiphila DSM 44928]
MFRTTSTASRTRRCSGAVAAATAAALMLAPGVAFAAGQPTAPGTGHAGSKTGTHAGGKGGSGGSHAGGKAGSHKTGRPGHTTGHAGAGHTASHKTGHTGAGHSTTHPTRHAGGAAAHGTKAATHGTNASASTGGPASGGSKNPQSPTSKHSAADETATVTKLSVAKVAEDGTVTMTARVSPAHRTAGAAEATGSVEFSIDGASSGPIPLSSGRAMVQAEVGPGEHTASAKYSGDTEHAPSDSGPVGVTAG